MEPSFSGKVAIVTGASREIGAAMAEALAQQGAAVVIGHRNEAALAQAVGARIQAAVHEFGRMDIFVANAGLTM